MTLIKSIQEMDEKSASVLEVIMDNYLSDDNNYDEEHAHQDADLVLSNLLLAIGCEKAVKAWEKIPKWYS